jgi:hypothetical protein
VVVYVCTLIDSGRYTQVKQFSVKCTITLGHRVHKHASKGSHTTTVASACTHHHKFTVVFNNYTRCLTSFIASLMSAVSNAIKLVRLAVRGDCAAVLSAVASLTLGSFVSST